MQKMNKTILGYVPEESPLYRIHPFVRLLFLMVVSLFPMFISSPEWNFSIILLVLVILIYSKVNLKTLRVYIPLSISMGILILLTHTVLGGRHPEFAVVFRIFGFPIYYERIVAAVDVYARILPMIFVMVLFLSTSRERDILVAFRWAKIPFVVTYLGAMALRSVGMVIEDFSIVRQAEKARGFDPKGKSIRYKMRQFVMYIIPLFALALRRSDEFANAIVARGYSFTGLRGLDRADYILHQYQFRTRDLVLTVVIILALVGVLIARYGFGYLGLDDSLTVRLLESLLKGGA